MRAATNVTAPCCRRDLVVVHAIVILFLLTLSNAMSLLCKSVQHFLWGHDTSVTLRIGWECGKISSVLNVVSQFLHSTHLSFKRVDTNTNSYNIQLSSHTNPGVRSVLPVVGGPFHRRVIIWVDRRLHGLPVAVCLLPFHVQGIGLVCIITTQIATSDEWHDER